MKRAREVSEQGGFRWFVLAILVAVLIGTLLRLSLAPSKIEKFVRAKIEASPIRDNLVFATAAVSLADGAIPDLALVLSKVEWRNNGECSDQAPIRARIVRVPVRLWRLFGGKISAGTAKIEDLTLDLDDLKRDCGAKAMKSQEPSGQTSIAASPTAPTSNLPFHEGEVWTVEDQARIAELVTGIKISRAEIFFENRMKSVMIEDALAVWRGDSLDVSTVIRFPPSTVFGENLPTFAINGTVKRREMIAEIRADLNEGALEANAVFRPIVAGNGTKELDANLKLSFSDLPLSVVTPLLSKSGIVTGPFQPKFMWLDCAAEIKGVFSRLFIENPVTLSGCAVSGQVGKLAFERAVRQPSGQWLPFDVGLENIDVERVLQTFELQGPAGVFENFGKLNGKLAFKSQDEAELSANLGGAVIRFAGAEGVGLQPFSIGKIAAKLWDRRWKLSLDEFHPDGGEADFKINADADRQGRNAEVDIVLNHLKFNSRVEKVIFTGGVADISGSSKLSFGFSQCAGRAVLTKLKAGLLLKEMRGSELNAGEFKIDAALMPGRPTPAAKTEKVAAQVREIEITARSNEVDVLKTGNFFRMLQPVLLGWPGGTGPTDGNLRLTKVNVKGHFRSDGFEWSQANAGVGKVLSLASHGTVFRDHALAAEIEAHFPMASRLKWSVAGTWMNPKFSAASPELAALFAKAGLPKESVTGAVPPRLLGIPKDAETPTF